MKSEPKTTATTGSERAAAVEIKFDVKAYKRERRNRQTVRVRSYLP